MLPLSNVNWGPSDALVADKKFHLKWMESWSVKACLRSESWIVSGEKGVGKSAIRRAIVEIYGDGYLATPVVDFDDITFRPLYENLLQFANITQLSKTTTLSHFWQYSILVELIKNCASKLPEVYGDILSKHDETMSKPASSGKKPVAKSPASQEPEVPSREIPLPQRLLTLTEMLWNKIDEYTRESTGKKSRGLSKQRRSTRANLVATSGLTSKFLAEMRTYPINQGFHEVRKQFFELLSRHEHKVILVLDGFDELRNDNAPADAINLLFESLVDAIQSIHSYQDLPEGIQIKAFIPHDRYLNISLRDSDKVDTMHAAIRWERSDLQEFLRKRLELTPRLHADTFQALWREVMPALIPNNHYKVEEDSFDYLVRHSMMRPRQLQIHLERLCTNYHNQVIDPGVVAKSIADSCKDMTSHFINEFQVDHPNLRQFIGSLHGKENVFEFSTLVKLTRDALRRFEKRDGKEDVLKKIDILYGMSFFGVVRFIETREVVGDIYCPPSKESRRHFVDFFYKNPHPSISSMLVDDSIVAIHPIFFDYASLRAHPTLIVG